MTFITYLLPTQASYADFQNSWLPHCRIQILLNTSVPASVRLNPIDETFIKSWAVRYSWTCLKNNKERDLV